MGLAQQFERRLEALVEGVFTRGGRSGVEPLELARKLRREMGQHRRVGLQGEVLVPNHFLARMSPDDYERFRSIEHALTSEIVPMLRQQADDEGWGLMGPVEVELRPDPGVKRGRAAVVASYKEAEGPTGATLSLSDGRTIEVTGERAVIGRLPDCEVVIDDGSVSRRHAEIRWDGRGYVVTDLGSTNGSLLNEAPVRESKLKLGDVLTVGRTRIEVRLS